MAKVVRYEFLGSVFWFCLLCLTVIGIPLALLHLMDGTVRFEEDVRDPTALLDAYRAGRLPTS